MKTEVDILNFLYEKYIKLLEQKETLTAGEYEIIKKIITRYVSYITPMNMSSSGILEDINIQLKEVPPTRDEFITLTRNVLLEIKNFVEG